MTRDHLIALLAAPITAVTGVVATAIVHQNISHNAAVIVGTYVATALVGLGAHVGFIRNTAKWWERESEAANDSPVL